MTTIQDARPEPTREELAALNDITPFTQGNTEPMMLLDLSGSMTWGAAPNADHPSRIDVVCEALPVIVRELEDEDSAAEGERAAGADAAEVGGVYTAGFNSDAHDFEDLNSVNLPTKRAEILACVGGGTRIVPGWNLLMEHYTEEFGDLPVQDQPRLVGLVITDGEAEDARAFGELLARQGNRTYVGVAIIGHGDAHDATVRQYQAVADASNGHVRVLTFDSVTNPLVIARSMLALIGK